MIKNSHPSASEDTPTTTLLDRLSSYMGRYSTLGSAQPLSKTEKRHLVEAKRAVQCIGLEKYIVPVPITDEKSLKAIVDAYTGNIPLDVATWLNRYAFYFVLVPIRVKEPDFKEAFITLRCDHILDPETQAPPLFYDLFPKTEFKDKARWIQSLALNLAEWAKLKVDTPDLPAELVGVEAGAGIDANVEANVNISYNFDKTWQDLLIKTSVPPTAEAEWHFRDHHLLRNKTIPVAFVLQMPKGLKQARISHTVKIKFNSPPWERTIARWIEALQSRFADMAPEEQKHISLVDGYVRTGFWAAQYTEEPGIWVLGETDFAH